MSADGTLQVDPESPWLGLSSFSEETRSYFHGREEEVAELGRRVQRKLLTVLFGQSGLGKTSILRAGLVPKLRPIGYCPVYVRIDYAPESPPPGEQIKLAIFRATEASGHWTKSGAAVTGESLWEFLHHRDDILKDDAGRTLTPILIFDQFEEIFTIAQTDGTVRERAAQFLAELADLVENRPPRELEARIEADDSLVGKFDFARADYRILISLREDYLAHLEGVKASMPSITQNRMRIARMTGDQALAAVTKPGGRLVTQEVAESIVRFVAGGSELRNAEVEPALLSLICRELNNARLAQGRPEITIDLLAGSHDTILGEFYERALADQPAGVRRFIEDDMLTESGYRESLAEERVLKAFAAAGAAPDALATLVNRRLLRVEERLDVRRVELTHDVLCAVVGASREVRHEREARDAAEKQLVEQKGREEATRKALVRARKVAAGAAALAIVAIAGAVFGWVNMERAREAEAAALDSRKLADHARTESEKLIVYLIEDFYRELEPVGRLDVVADLAKRAVDYYDALPATLRGPETQRNRALAQVRMATAYRNLGRLDEAGKAGKDATTVLRGLREKGDHSEAAAIGLALGLALEGRVASSRARTADDRVLTGQGYALLKPLAQAPGASEAVRRAFAGIGNGYGFALNRSGDQVEAIKVLEEARAAYTSLGMGDHGTAAGYAEATAWMADAYAELGRNDELIATSLAALDVVNPVLEQRPNHMNALRARALLSSGLARAHAGRLQFEKALVFSAGGIRDWEAFVALDPGNTIAWNNLGSNYMESSWALEFLGRPDEALAYTYKAVEIERRMKVTEPPAFLARNLAWTMHMASRREANRGQLAKAREMLERQRGAAALFTRDLAKTSFGAYIGATQLLRSEVEIAQASGDYAAMRDVARAAIKRSSEIALANEGQKQLQREIMAAAQAYLAEASLQLRDYEAAEGAGRAAVEARSAHGDRDVIDRIETYWISTFHIRALAKLGRTAEAQALARTTLANIQAVKADKAVVIVGEVSANVKVAMAAAFPAESARWLGEATAHLDRMTPATQKLKTTQRLRDEIARMKSGARS